MLIFHCNCCIFWLNCFGILCWKCSILYWNCGILQPGVRRFRRHTIRSECATSGRSLTSQSDTRTSTGAARKRCAGFVVLDEFWKEFKWWILHLKWWIGRLHTHLHAASDPYRWVKMMNFVFKNEEFHAQKRGILYSKWWILQPRASRHGAEPRRRGHAELHGCGGPGRRPGVPEEGAFYFFKIKTNYSIEIEDSSIENDDSSVEKWWVSKTWFDSSGSDADVVMYRKAKLGVRIESHLPPSFPCFLPWFCPFTPSFPCFLPWFWPFTPSFPCFVPWFWPFTPSFACFLPWFCPFTPVFLAFCLDFALRLLEIPQLSVVFLAFTIRLPRCFFVFRFGCSALSWLQSSRMTRNCWCDFYLIFSYFPLVFSCFPLIFSFLIFFIGFSLVSIGFPLKPEEL